MKANYIIFHPESQRQHVHVNGDVVLNNELINGWDGDIWVDKMFDCNEDPFVFNDPWIYSYCHASQLRRCLKHNGSINTGSYLIFVNGTAVNKNKLAIDTVFCVGSILEWKRNKEKGPVLPLKYQLLLNDKESELWKRHLKFPFCGYHASVTHTYEAEMWSSSKKVYSFLPINSDGDRVTLDFSDLNKEIADKILSNIKGKKPVLLTDDEVEEILSIIKAATTRKVVRIISCDVKGISNKGKNCNC